MTQYKIPESVLVLIYSPSLNILMLERADKPGFWQSVTGSRDTLEEPLTQTALRELNEETGLQVDTTAQLEGIGSFGVLVDMQHRVEYEIFQHWRWRYPPGVTHNIEHWFSLCVDQQTPIHIAPKEHLQYQWLPWQGAVQRCFSPSNRQAIEGLAAHFAAANAY